MQRYFIADLHLTEDEPAIKAGFFSFLDSLPDGCELYILGDLFDYWVGDDTQTPLHQDIALALKQLSMRQIKKYFVCGNRDFLLGKQYAKDCDMQILPDINCIQQINLADQRNDNQIAQQNLLFLHGDLLCIDDVSYQKFRKKMHSKWLQRLFLSLPLRFRQSIALKLRQKSKAHNQVKSNEIMDVNQQTVVEMMINYNASHMIHGHTHKPATHHFVQDGKSYQRIVLAAWHDGVSYIKQDDADNSIALYSHSFK